MVRVTRLVAVPVAVSVAILGLLAGCSGDEGSEPPGDPAAASSSGSSGTAGDDDEPLPAHRRGPRSEIRALLKTRASALEQATATAFLATVDPADDELVQAADRLFDNLQLLPVESVSLQRRRRVRGTRPRTSTGTTRSSGPR